MLIRPSYYTPANICGGLANPAASHLHDTIAVEKAPHKSVANRTKVAHENVNFVIQLDTSVIPIEVKAEENLQPKSLKTTLTANPGMMGLRFSMSDYREQDNITNVPPYGARAYLLQRSGTA